MIQLLNFINRSKRSLNQTISSNSTIGWSELHFLAASGNVTQLENFFSNTTNTNNTNIDVQDSLGRTPLYLALAGAHTQTVDILLQNCANPHIRVSQGRTLLHLAAIQGETQVVHHLLLSYAVDPNAVDVNLLQPLHYAVQYAHTDIAEALLNCGAQANGRNLYSDEKSPLDCIDELTESDALAMVKVLASHNAFVGRRVGEERKPIMRAIRLGRLSLVKYYLEQVRVQFDYELLFKATYTCNNRELIEYMFDYYNNEANNNVVRCTTADLREHLFQPYDRPVKLDLELTKFLIGFTEGPTEKACCANEQVEFLFNVVRTNNLEIVKYLFEEKKLNYDDSGFYKRSFHQVGSTVINIVAGSGNVELLKYLFTTNSKLVTLISNPFNPQEFPLFNAVQWNGQLDMIKFLLENGATFQIINTQTKSLVCEALTMKKFDIARHLIERVHAHDLKFENARNCAVRELVRQGELELLRYLFDKIDRNVKSTLNYHKLLVGAIESGKVEMVKSLLTKINNANNLRLLDIKYLHLAAESRQFEIAQHLLANFEWANLNVLDEDNAYSVLHLAVKNGNLKMTELLLSYDSQIDVNMIGRDDKSVLDMAIGNFYRDANDQTKYLQLIKLLISKGARVVPYEYDVHKRTVVLEAIGNEANDIVRYLIDECGAEFSLTDKRSFTPLLNAVARSNLEMVRYLLTKGADDANSTCALLSDYPAKTRENKIETISSLEIAQNYVNRYSYVKLEKKFAKLVHFLVNDYRCEQNGRTFLHKYSSEGKVQMVEFVLQNQGTWNRVDTDQNTALHLAAQAGHLDVVKLLLLKNAKQTCSFINSRNSANLAAAELAKMNGHAQVVELIHDSFDQSEKFKPNKCYLKSNSLSTVTSSASSPNSLINNAFGLVSNLISPTISQTQTILKSFPYFTSSHFPTSTISSLNFSNIILLFDVFTRKLTGQKYINTETIDITKSNHFMEARGVALNITQQFERKLFKLSGKQVDTFDLFKSVEKALLTENYHKIEQMLNDNL